MKTRRTIIWLLISSSIGSLIGYLLSNSYNLGFCYSSLATNTFDVSCHAFYERLGTPLFYGMLALSFVFLFLIFVPQAFSAWKRFAIWFIPLATLLFIFYPEPNSGDYFSPYPEQIFQWVSGLYVIISVLVIGWSSVKKAKMK